MRISTGIAVALATVACSLAAGAGSASATQYASHVGVEGGANAFGPFVSLHAAETVGFGSGLGCAGIRGVAGVVCEIEPGEAAVINLGSYVNSEPYIHNHSTFKSFFNGFYY